MPLNKSGSEKSVGENISTEMHAHPEMKQKQAIAIAESVKRAANDGEGCPFGASAPLGTHDYGYKDGDPVGGSHGGFSQVGTAEQFAHASRQMWAQEANEGENKNGVTTPDGAGFVTPS